MANILKQKNAKYIEWSVEVPSSFGYNVTSETFFYQGGECNLEFYSGSHIFGGSHYASLSFKNSGELQIPVTVTIRIFCNSECLVEHLEYSIPSTNQNIWRHTNILTSCRLTFELTFQADYSKNEKSVQTPSYIDNCFLMDGISQDFSKMLNESRWHDLEFVCGDQSIKAHKSVLCYRSDVFASMLQSDMVEGKTGRVNIQDMDATLFQQFLRCLYTGVLPTLTVDTALQFYAAGDKYNITSLKKQCADFLIDNLLHENAYDILILADRHNDPGLKRNVIDFIIKEQIPYTGEKWIDFCKKNSMIANEVLNLFASIFVPNKIEDLFSILCR